MSSQADEVVHHHVIKWFAYHHSWNCCSPGNRIYTSNGALDIKKVTIKINFNILFDIVIKYTHAT